MEFVDESTLFAPKGKPQAAGGMQFVDEYSATGVPPKPATFLENLGGFLTDADSWKEMGQKAAAVGLGTVDLVAGVPGMAASAVANLAGRTVGAVQGLSRKEVEAKGLEYRSYIPEGFVTPLQTAAKALGLPPLDQSGMEAVMNAAGGFVDKQTGGVISDQDAKDAIEIVFLKGGMVANKALGGVLKGKIDAKYGPKKAATGDRRGEVSWEELTDEAGKPKTVEPLTERQLAQNYAESPYRQPATPSDAAIKAIADSKKRIADAKKRVGAAVKAETPAEKVSRMAAKQLEEGQATWSTTESVKTGDNTWTSQGVEHPVTVMGEAAKGPDGRYYTPVKYGKTETYVPTDELLAAKAPEPQVGLPPPVRPATPEVFPPSGQKGRWETPLSSIKPTPRRAPLETGLAKLENINKLGAMDQAQLRAEPGSLLTLDERAALGATQQAGARVVGPDGKPLGSGFTESGQIDPRLLAALGITSAAVWAALNPEDMEKLAGIGLIGATTLSGKNRALGALMKESAPYHMETLLKFPAGVTELGKQQVLDMAKKFPAEEAVLRRVVEAAPEGKKISAADLVNGVNEEIANWKLTPKETDQYADYGLENIDRQSPDAYRNGRTPSPEDSPPATTTLYQLPEHMQVSDANHFGDSRLFGWTRSFKEDGVTHVVELQSDLAQHAKGGLVNREALLQEQAVNRERLAELNRAANGRGYDSDAVPNAEVQRLALRQQEIRVALAEVPGSIEQLSPIIRNWPRRLIRETLLKETQAEAARVKELQDGRMQQERLGLDTSWYDEQLARPAQPVRFASADTVAKVEGWPDKRADLQAQLQDPFFTPEGRVTLQTELDSLKSDFYPEHQPIYNRYAGEITRYLKGLGGKEVTDAQGHTWIEVPTDSAMQSYGPGIKMLGAADTKLLATIAAGSALGAYLIANPDKRDGMLAMMGLGIAAKGGLRDADLLGHIKSGGKVGEAATAELYRKYAPQMERTLQGKFGRQGVDVQEAIQDGFFHSIRVVEKGHFRGDAEFSTYLHRAVVNRALNQLRAAKSRPETVSLTEDPNTGRSALADSLGHEDTPANLLQSRDMGAQIDAALERIDPRFSEAFLAVERDGMSYEAAAEAQGIPINTLRSRIYRAKAALQEELAAYKDGAGLSRTPEDRSTAPLPRLGDIERGAIDPELAKLMGLAAAGTTAGVLYADDNSKGAIVGGLLVLSARLLGTAPAQSALKRGTTTMLEILPELRRASRDMEHAAAVEISQASETLSGFLKELKKLPKANREAFDKAYSEGDSIGRAKALAGNSAAAMEYQKVRKMFEGLADRLITEGRFKKAIPDYLPLMVKDYKGLMNSLGYAVKEELEGLLHNANLKSLKTVGRELNEVEKSAIVGRYLLNEPSTSYLPSFAKTRRLKMTPETRKFYHTMEHSLIHATHAMVEDLATTKFFGKDLVVSKSKAGKKTYTNVEGSISALINRAIEEGRLTPEDSVKLREVLHARFVGGERAPAPWLQDVRNISSIGLLGQVGSGIIQTSEFLLSSYHHGILPALKSAGTLITGKGIKPAEFGLANHVIEEVVGQRKTGKALSAVLKANLLAPLDQIGMRQNLTSSFVKNKALAATERGRAKLAEKWGSQYGTDMPALIKDLQASTMTKRGPLTESLLYAELSDLRPTSRMEAPPAFNGNPNLRLFWHLKQFMLTQADIIYRDSVMKIATGKPAQIAIGLKNLALFASALALSQVPADMIKGWIMGRPLELDKVDYVDNFTRSFGIGRYNIDMVGNSTQPGKQVVQTLEKLAAPPALSVLETAGKGLSSPKEAVPLIPLVGRAIYNRELGGNEKAEITQSRKDGSPLSPAAKRYLREKRKEAEKRKREKERN